MVIPESGRYVLARAAVPSVLLDSPLRPGADGLTLCDIVVDDGRIAEIVPPRTAAGDFPVVDRQNRQVWPGLVDLHTHLDKGHILSLIHI